MTIEFYFFLLEVIITREKNRRVSTNMWNFNNRKISEVNVVVLCKY